MIGTYDPPQLLRRSAVSEMVRGWEPISALGLIIRRTIPHLPADLAAELLDTIKRSVIIESSLSAKVYRNLGLFKQGLIPWDDVRVENYGVVSRRVVTTAGVNFIVDAFGNTQEVENFKYHAIGTGTNAEAVGDTALQTELTTQYNPDNTRATGSQTENGANVYRTVGTNTLDSGTPAVTEHGILTQAATGGGTLLDRSVFSAINLTGANGDGLQTTYDLTCAAGG